MIIKLAKALLFMKNIGFMYPEPNYKEVDVNVGVTLQKPLVQINMSPAVQNLDNEMNPLFARENQKSNLTLP